MGEALWILGICSSEEAKVSDRKPICRLEKAVFFLDVYGTYPE
jgi:hypothetical protein